MSPLKCIRYVHLDTVDLLETLPPRQRRKYRRHWRERNWAARNDYSSTTVGRGSFSCSNIIPSNPNIPNISGLRQTTQTGCCAVFSPPTCTKGGGKKGGKNCQLPNLDFPPTSIGGTPATSWPQLQPHHLPHHTTRHSFSCRRVLPPPFPQAPFFRVSRRGSCHDFHSCSSFLEQLQHLDRRPEQIRQDPMTLNSATRVPKCPSVSFNPSCPFPGCEVCDTAQHRDNGNFRSPIASRNTDALPLEPNTTHSMSGRMGR